MTEQEQALEELAEALERLENMTAALRIPMAAQFHVEALRESLPEVKAEIKAAYLKLGGVDHWQDHPAG